MAPEAAVVVGVVLENLQQLLLSDENHTNLDDQIQVEQLKKDLSLFKSFLTGTVTDSNLLQIVNNITNAVYKAADAIEKLIIENRRFKEKGFYKKGFKIDDHTTTLLNALKEVESLLKTDANQIYEQKPILTSPHTVATVEKPPAVEVEKVVGLDGVAETIIKRLNNVDKKDLDILTIVGMPGLGKTTLARKIYNDPAIEYEFSTRAFACVAQKYSRREVYLTILDTIKQKITYRHRSSDDLAEELYTLLKNERYLIVLDDVWTPEAWEHLKIAFPENNKGSRILITSRHENVAKRANPRDGTHAMKFLTQKESWELLESKVFGNGKCPTSELQTLGEHVAEKCEGLPIAIVVVAGILFNHDESEWWKKVAENVSPSYVKNEEEFRELIAMSYNHLPYHLKPCFLYFAVFPENHEIPVWKLIRLWIAEGFIEPDGNQTLEEIADLYLANLVNRNLLMPLKRRSDGQIKTCHVHDMLYDFCKKEAEKQNHYHEILSADEVTSEYYRRLCIHDNVLEYVMTKPQGPRVRSFFSFSPDDFYLPREFMTTIPKAFELLRVLDMTSIILVMFPKDLLSLTLLRYLAFTSNIKALPSTFSKLLNLQILIHLTKFPTVDLREDFWKLYQLRHFHTNASAKFSTPPIGSTKGMEHAQTLSTISPDSCTEHILASTPNIKKLGVKGQIGLLFNTYFDNIGNLQHLTNLKLFNDDGPYDGKLSIPPAIKFPRKLKKLTISNTMLDWEQMKILGDLEGLEVLKLKANAFEGEIWEPKDGGFVSLKYLYISETNLVTWKASQHHFPSLERLVLRLCENLVEIPFGFAEITSFQVLELFRTNSTAAASARKIQGKKLVKAVKETTSSVVFKLSVFPRDM